MDRKSKKIVIVDDSLSIRELLGEILRGEGYEEIHFASSAEELLSILGIHAPTKRKKFLDVDLILLDIMMPGMDGIEVCSIIKSHDHFRDVPVVMVTMRNEMEVLQKAFAAGAIDYIVKPADDTELLARVRSFLRLKDEMDARKAREKELLSATSKLRKANNTLQRLSYIDALTDIGNRRYFDELYSKEWRRARREKTSLGVVLIDIDFFKSFNDMYGHQSGDECLKDVAQAISDALKRPVDFAARYGGEEFAVILPDTDAAGGRYVAENIMREVSALKIPHAASEVAEIVTVSMGGVAMIPKSDDRPEDLVARADEALYKAKNQGRNQIIC